MTLREHLDLIDQWLSEPSEHAVALWNVLTALRGPDSRNDPMKSATTAVIRAAAFPLTAQRLHQIPATFRFGHNAVTIWEEMRHTHFGHHAVRAAELLGLTVRWEKGL